MADLWRRHKKTAGSLPILFAGIGPCAERTLAEFARAARSLKAPVRGPFGLALVDSFGEELYTCDWPWVSEFHVPDLPVVHERAEFVGDSEDKLAASLAALVRRLRSVEPASDPAAPARVRMNTYVIVDLSVAGVVASATRLVQTLRKVDVAHDMTVVALTGRTAVTSSVTDNGWFETWRQLLAQIQDQPFAQRIYLLDGCDADKTWFERPEQLYLLGARFLLHHGLLCRQYLRQNERARTGSKESLLHVCGSFGCRTIEADLPGVGERIAETVAKEDLADSYRRSAPDGWLESIDERAKALADKIAGVCERTHHVKPSAANERRDRSDAFPSQTAEASEAIARTIKHVCSREPLISLCHFFTCLQPRLGRVLNKQRLWDRARMRQFALEALRRQDETTYEPMRVWLSNPDTAWTDRFTPERGEAPQVAVSRPAAGTSFLAGTVVLALALAGVAAGLLSFGRVFMIVGGLVAVGASVLMSLPTGWTRKRRARLREGQSLSDAMAPTSYRKRASFQAVAAAVVLMLAGLSPLAWAVWPAGWTPITIMWSMALAVISAIGIAFIAGCPPESHPEQASDEEVPGHARPPAWRCRATGIACLGLAWVIFCLGAAWPVTLGNAGLWIVPIAGLLVFGMGMVLALRPRVGQVYLVDRVAKMPLPFQGGIGRPIAESDLDRGLIAMTAWINRLALDPDQCLQRSEASEPSCAGETLLDFLAADWDRQLAEAFRRALKNRSGKSIHTLAEQSVLWVECIIKELDTPRSRCADLTSLFALQAVRAWLESHTLADLIGMLEIDVARFGRLISRLAAPHWPATRVEPESGAAVVAVGKSLWEVLAPMAKGDDAPPMVPLECDCDRDEVLVLRVVQGLTEGWRGFPGMPGQIGEKPMQPIGDGQTAETTDNKPQLPTTG